MRASLPFLSFVSTTFVRAPHFNDFSYSSINDKLTLFEPAQCFSSNHTTTPDQPGGDDEFSELIRRAAPCQAGYNSCSTLAVAFSAVCCSSTAVCSNDNIGNVACCPIGSFCTGTINTAVASTVVPASTTDGAIAPLTTTSLSYVPNAYFPFPYIATTFTDQPACLSAYSACTSNSAICSANLAGNVGVGFGVTIVAPGGGGVTVNAATTGANLGAASASSICSSLESQACSGLSLGNCGITATAAATATNTGFVIVSEGASRSESWGLGLIAICSSLLMAMM